MMFPIIVHQQVLLWIQISCLLMMSQQLHVVHVVSSFSSSTTSSIPKTTLHYLNPKEVTISSFFTIRTRSKLGVKNVNRQTDIFSTALHSNIKKDKNNDFTMLLTSSSLSYSNNNNNDNNNDSNKNNDQQTDSKRRSRRIWIIDDEELILNAVGKYIQSSGYQIQTFTNASVPLSLLQKKTSNDYNHKHDNNKNDNVIIPDAIISDILMPNVTGLQLLQIIRSNPKIHKIPFIFLTAKGTTEDRIKGYNYGVDGYLMKPFDPEELVVMLDRLVDRREFLDDENVNVETDDNLVDMNVLFQHERKEGVSIDELKNDLDEIKVLLRKLNGRKNGIIDQRMNKKMNNVMKQLPALSSSSSIVSTTLNDENGNGNSNGKNSNVERNDGLFVTPIDDNDDNYDGDESIIDMTNDEMEVLKLLCEGYMNKEIANELKYSIRWVEGVLTKLYRKTNCSNRTELVKWAVSLGYVDV